MTVDRDRLVEAGVEALAKARAGFNASRNARAHIVGVVVDAVLAEQAAEPERGREPTHICLDCGKLGYAGGYHDHGDGNAGDTCSIATLLSDAKRIGAENDELHEELDELRAAEPTRATDPAAS